MINIEKSVLIKKPVSVVFAYSQDMNNYSKWQGEGNMQMIKGRDNEVGSRYVESYKILGKEIKNTVEITAFKKNELWAARVIEGMLPYSVIMAYTEVPEGTRLIMTIEGEASGFFKLTEKVITASIEKDVEKSLLKLKALLESNPHHLLNE